MKLEKISFSFRELEYMCTLLKTEARKRKYKSSDYSSYFQQKGIERDELLIKKLEKAIEFHKFQLLKKNGLIEDGETLDQAIERNYIEIQENIKKDVV